jgi:TolB-like protein/DNA-binding winged helix-turn-helix (wHTH) protein/Flp pilus assembly protein TadD
MNDLPEAVYEFGEFRFDPGNNLLSRNGIAVPLTPKVFQTLALLLENAGRLVEKDEFLRRLWPGTFVEEAAVAENISRLRRALGDGDVERFIVTVPKRGYRFVAGVTRRAAAMTASAEPVAARPIRSPMWEAHRLALLGVAMLSLLALVYFGFRRPLRASPGAPAAPIRSLAVLPFENLSGDSEQEYFADGMTDELTTQLARISALRVISRTSVMRFKGARKPLADIVVDLNVDAVIEGTVVRSAERVRVTAKVIQAGTEQHLWAERYERPLGDVVALQGELAREIAQAIRIQLTPQERTRLADLRPVGQEAYEAFLKGRYYLGKRTEATTRKAIGYFQQAIDKEPTYALAQAGLADSYLSLALTEALQEVLPPREAFPRARAAANRALEIDGSLGEAHTTLAHIKFQYDRDWSGAEEEVKQAIQLSPNHAQAHLVYALLLMWMGRLDEALYQVKRAQELDPLSLAINANRGFILAGAGQYDQAISQCRKTVDMDPGFALTHYRLGQIFVLSGASREAIPELEQAIALSGGSPRATAELGLAHAQLGHRMEALKLLEELKQQSKRRYVSSFNIALIYGGIGDREHALAWLEKAYEERSPSLSHLQLTPAFAQLRSDGRFVDLVRRVGLPPRGMRTGGLTIPAQARP